MKLYSETISRVMHADVDDAELSRFNYEMFTSGVEMYVPGHDGVRHLYELWLSPKTVPAFMPADTTWNDVWEAFRSEPMLLFVLVHARTLGVSWLAFPSLPGSSSGVTFICLDDSYLNVTARPRV